MTISAQELNRATLERQLLLKREPLEVAEGVRRVVALQAQHPASPYIAMWNRLADFDPGELDAAFAGRSVVKATLMRITLHAVHADDYTDFHTAMQPTLRAARLYDRRFTETGFTSADADALVPGALEFATKPRTNADAEAWVAERLGAPAKRVWWALRHYAPFVHAPTGGPWSFGQRPSYIASGHPPAPPGQAAADERLATLIRRYLEGFGPASVADMAQFALVRRSRIRVALEALSSVLDLVDGPDGVLYDVPGARRPAADIPAPPRLLPMWDNVLLAYADRSRVIPPEYRKLVIGNNGDVLPTLLVDGYVAGVWRPVDGGIEATAFHALDDRAWDGLAAEAKPLLSLLADRERTVYRRYDRWWADLPSAEVRVLAE
jgi:hypothetical protein